MANLKQDLLNDLGNEKYYAELELGRLAADPNMNYEKKVKDMTGLLKRLASVDLATQLIGKYFQDQPTQAAPTPNTDGAPAPAPEQAKPHPGQSHGE